VGVVMWFLPVSFQMDMCAGGSHPTMPPVAVGVHPA
jgi:hypothetical protein